MYFLARLSRTNKFFAAIVHSKEYRHIEKRLFMQCVLKFLGRVKLSILNTPPGWFNNLQDYRAKIKIAFVSLHNRFIDVQFSSLYYRCFYSKGHKAPTKEEEGMLLMEGPGTIHRICCGYCGKLIFSEDTSDDTCKGELGYKGNTFRKNLEYYDRKRSQLKQRSMRRLLWANGKSDPILNIFARMDRPKVIPNSILQMELVYNVKMYFRDPELQIQAFGLDFIFDYNVILFRKMRELYAATEIMKALPQSYTPDYYKQVMGIRESIERMYLTPMCDISIEELSERSDDSDFNASDTEEEDPDYNEIEPMPKRRRMKRRK